MQHDILSAVTAPCAAARRWRTLARCGWACAASVTPLRRAARYSSTVQARQRSCEQNARPLQSALLPLVEVVVGLAAARGVVKSVPPSRAVPSRARRARSRLCDVHTSVRRCRNVHVSSMCSAVELCFGVCIMGVHARVLARACGYLLRRCCRMGPAPPDAAHPAPTSGTEVQRSRASTHPPSEHCSRKF